MKFNKAIICLIVCFLVLNAVEARKGKSQLAQKSGKGFFDRMFQNWNQVTVEIDGSSTYKFKCSIKDVELGKVALGVAFDGFEQLTSKDKTGFMQYIQKLYKVDDQDLQKPVLDYRFIQGCIVLDNANESTGDWRLEMNLRANEEYNNLASANQNKGQSWRMKIHMPAANKAEATKFKSSLMKNCQIRNKKMNELKDKAIAAGNNYNSLYYGFENREQSLQDMALMTDNAEKVVDDVKNAQVEEQKQIQASVEANQQLLDQTLEQIQKTATLKQTTEQETEALSVQLQEIQAKLVQLRNQQDNTRNNIALAQKEISQVQKLKQKLDSEKKKLDSKQTATQTEAEAEKAKADKEQKEFERQMLALQKQQEAAKAAAAAAQASRANQLKELQDLIASTDSSISEKQKQIADLLVKISLNNQQVSNIDAAMVPVQEKIAYLIQKISDNRSTAENMAAALKRSQAEKKATEAEINNIQVQGEKQLEALGKKLQDQLKLVKKLSEDERKKQEYFITQAQADIKKAYGDFKAALQLIVDQSQVTSFETKQAFEQVLHGKHVQHVAAVVSVNKELMKMSLLRLAKYNRQMQRLARARLSQMTSVRLQQKKLQNKLRKSHKHLSA